MSPMTREPDPRKVKVQLNIPVTWEFMAHLDEISSKTKTSKAQLARDALEAMYPLDLRPATRDAGATR